ncbi:MAG: 1-acyl-sn-glycerol-3-phosphate acyltransferase [Acidobacteria bacterium]|nr:1-acyl-sn-glycerol-3-phosphate acyltransferase [Acidobacteriota bacterium]
MIRTGLRAVVEALFRVLFTYDCLDEEKLPERGPAVIAANHPSYLDPVLLSLQVSRPIRFMAWDRLFRIPLLGALMRVFGAFPVDVRPGRGQDAYAKARELLDAGELVGMFPEGKRSRSGWLEERLREGAARLAWETGAPLVPATITGAFRAWPYFRALPEPARIRVRYHDPIDPEPYRRLPEDEGVAALLDELRRRVERTLMPGVKADLRIEALYQTSAPWPRLFESLPALGFALLVFWKTRSFSDVWPCYAYIGYLLADLLVIPQRRLTKWIRNGSALAFTLVYGGWVLPKLGLPEVPGGGALLALIAGATFPYLYERGRVALGYLEGMVVTALLSLGVMYIAPTGLGPHLALPLFAAVYAWERQTVFWRYTAPILAAYAVLVPLWLGGSIELLPWAIAALVAGLLGRLFSSGPSLGEVGDTTAPVADPSPLGLASEGERRVAEGDAPPAAEEAQSAAPSGPSLGLLDEPPSPSPSSPKKPNPPPGLLDW